MEASTNQNQNNNQITDELFRLKRAIQGYKTATMCLATAIEQEDPLDAEGVDGLFFTLNSQAQNSYEKLELLLKNN